MIRVEQSDLIVLHHENNACRHNEMNEQLRESLYNSKAEVYSCWNIDAVRKQMDTEHTKTRVRPLVFFLLHLGHPQKRKTTRDWISVMLSDDP